MPAGTDDPTSIRCRATINGERCAFRGDRDQILEHTAAAGHPQCAVCSWPLAGHEQQTCRRCTATVRDDLDAVAVAYAHLDRIIAGTGYHPGTLPGGAALVLIADGSVDGLRPYKPPADDVEPVQVDRLGVGDHEAYVECRTPPTGREHFDDHWPTDPASVLAQLEANERGWRRAFGHGPADEIATVGRCLTYLRDWHLHAATHHPAFVDYAAEVAQLRARLEHVVGMADDPVVAPIWCTCGGRLERHFAPQGGLADDWTCRRCSAVLDEAAYLLRLRVLTEVPGWVSVDSAARTVDRPAQTVWAWVRGFEIPVACSRFTRRITVELVAVQARSDAAGRVTRRSA